MADILASLAIAIGAEISGFDRGVATVKKELAGLVKAGERLQSIGQSLSLYVTAPLVGAGAVALKVGGDFQAAFNRVESATQASGAELDALRKKAHGIALDPKLQFSSVQAAQALENLAKNGLTTAQILGGAADASTALATATGGTLATAADITTDVMNQFSKSAEQATGLVSNITGTTIASKFGIDDYRLALGQAGAVAGQMGVSFEDFNTALGVTSSGFSSGQDAGTSFKTFLQRLVPQSKEAKGAIEQLGLQFFDAQGKMKPLRDIAGQLQQAFKGLSDEQRNALGTKIFGADSIRTALLLAKEGAEGFDKMAVSIGKVDAAAQGGILNKGFTGAAEAFKSALEGAGQAIADAGILDFATDMAQAGAALAASVATADPAVLKFAVGLAAAAAAVGPVLVAVGSLGAALPFISAGLVALTGPIGIAVAAIAALGVGLALVVANSTDATEEFKKQKSSVTALADSVNPLLTRYDELKAKSTLTKAEQEELRAIIEKVGKQIPTSITAFDSYGRALDINTGKARDFVKAQQEILAIKNRDALTQQREEYHRLTGEIQGATNALNTFDKQGNLVKFIGSGDDLGGDFFPLTAKEITDLQTKLDGLRTARRGVGGLIDELKGIRPAAEEAGKALPLPAPVTPLAIAQTAAQTKELEKQLKALQALDKGYSTIGARTTKGTRPKDAPEFIELAVPKLPELPTRLEPLDNADYIASLRATAAAAAQFNIDYGQATQTAIALNESVNQILEQGLQQLAVGIGEALGNALAGSQNLGDALAQTLLRTVGSVAVQLGELAIGVGIGIKGINLALESLNPYAAVAAGIALVALGSFAKSKAASIGSSGASPSGGGSYSPPSFNPSRVPEQVIKIELAPVTFRQKGPDLEGVVGVSKYRRLRLS